MAKKAKLLWSSPWLRRDRYNIWTDGTLDLCPRAIKRFFGLPSSANAVCLRVFDKPSGSERLLFRLKQIQPKQRAWMTWAPVVELCYTHSTTSRPRGVLLNEITRRLLKAPLGWKDGKATVWAEIEWR